MTQSKLTANGFKRGLSALAHADGGLARALEQHGAPPFWLRQPGFATLSLMVLEQQVTLASGRAMFNKLTAAVAPYTPENLLARDPAEVKKIGITRQKLAACRALAGAIVDRQLDLDATAKMTDKAACEALTRVKGIGPWTANVYLLLALGRRDIWPVGDLALVVAVQELRSLDQRPTATQMEQIGEDWRPWRGVATRLLWHRYLSLRGRTMET